MQNNSNDAALDHSLTSLYLNCSHPFLVGVNCTITYAEHLGLTFAILSVGLGLGLGTILLTSSWFLIREIYFIDGRTISLLNAQKNISFSVALASFMFSILSIVAAIDHR
eukprot:Awhi_evm1s3299